jgi:MFS family permease
MATKPWRLNSRDQFGPNYDTMPSQEMHQARNRNLPDDESSCDQATNTTGHSTLCTNFSNPANPYNVTTGVLLSYPLPGLDNEIATEQIAPVQARSQSLDITDAPLSEAVLELDPVSNRQADRISIRRSSFVGLPEEHGSSRLPVSQAVPPELGSLLAEIIFVLTCTAGQIIASLIVGHITVAQTVFREALGIPPAQSPWLIGSSLLASGLSVIISGSLADLAPPKPLMVGAFLWEAIWNAVTAVAISPNLKILFFVARAMNGLAVGVLVTTSMSILGRVYNPGIRKTRVFSFMAAGSPLGFWIGCVQGGALSAHLPWIFGSTSIFLAIFALAAHLTVPSLRPASDSLTAEAPSLRQFDYPGAFLSSMGCSLILFGLTQGSSAHWNPYTYCLIILGFLMLGGFYVVEQRVARPIIPNGLWRTPGFAALLISYFLGLGAYSRSLISCSLAL